MGLNYSDEFDLDVRLMSAADEDQGDRLPGTDVNTCFCAVTVDTCRVTCDCHATAAQNTCFCPVTVDTCRVTCDTCATGCAQATCRATCQTCATNCNQNTCADTCAQTCQTCAQVTCGGPNPLCQ